MNGPHDKPVDCLDIRFPVPRRRRRSGVVGLRLHSSPHAERKQDRNLGSGGDVPRIGLFDCCRATRGKPSLRAIAPRRKYPFTPPVCAAAPSPCCHARRFSGPDKKFPPAARWPVEALIPGCVDNYCRCEASGNDAKRETFELEPIAKAFQAISKEISYGGLAKAFSRLRWDIPEPFEALSC